MSDAHLPGDPESPIKTEAVEDWTFVGVNGVTATYRLHVERGEKAVLVQNAIDQTLVMVQLLLKDGTEKNETAAVGGFFTANLISFFKTMGTAPIYAKGESPAEKEIVRLDMIRKERDEAFKARHDAIDKDFTDEMGRIEP